MLRADRIRLAKAAIAAAVLASDKEKDGPFIEKLTRAVSAAVNVEPAAVTQDLKLDYIVAELAVIKTGVAGVAIALHAAGIQVPLSPESLGKLGVEVKERSPIVLPG